MNPRLLASVQLPAKAVGDGPSTWILATRWQVGKELLVPGLGSGLALATAGISEVIQQTESLCHSFKEVHKSLKQDKQKMRTELQNVSFCLKLLLNKPVLILKK